MKRTWPRSTPRFTCPGCGERHELASMDVGFDLPDAALAVPQEERAARVNATADVADVDREAFFVRGVLGLPVQGLDGDAFGLGVWVRVSKEHFFRYLERYRDEDQANEPPFPGTVANLVAEYPPTLGVPVLVHVTSAAQRPTLTVQPCGHPLAAEQRDGMAPERLMRITAPYAHPGRVPALGEPRFARMDADAWTLQSARDRYLRRDGLYWVPSDEDLADLQPGRTVKLIFHFASSDARGEPIEAVERMWVEVDHLAEDAGGALLCGVLKNQAFAPTALREGTRVWFRREHVLDVWCGDEALSAGDAVRCERHGVSEACYVCRHLAARQGSGFHQAANTGALRPDAWCDACERVVAEEGGDWTDRVEELAAVKLVCGGCYDMIEQHARAG